MLVSIKDNPKYKVCVIKVKFFFGGGGLCVRICCYCIMGGEKLGD
jgi:hypothetical protein